MKKAATAQDNSQALVSIKDQQDLQNALHRLENAEAKVGLFDKEMKKCQQMGFRKDAKRQRELGRVQRDLQEARGGASGNMDQAIENELNNGLLRMAELHVKSEMKCEMLEEQLKEKDEKIKMLEAEVERLKQENMMARNGEQPAGYG